MSNRGDSPPDTAALDERRQRFLVIHRDADDVLGWRDTGGAVALDDGRNAGCIRALVDNLGGDRHASVVWAAGQPPARCCTDQEHQVP